MPFRIKWKSCSQWSGTEQTMDDGDEEFATQEEAQAAKDEMEKDEALMKDLWDQGCESQGIEAWLEIEEED